MKSTCKRWTDEELQYLQDNWDSKSKQSIAKKLDRSIEAVKLKAHRIGLRNMLHTSDFLTLAELMKILGLTYYGGLPAKLEALDFPFKHRNPKAKLKVRIVHVEAFIKWSENNPDVLSFAKLEPYGLGLETDFIKKKRERDKAMARRKIWEPEDDILLKSMLSQHRFTKSEIAKRLKCTEGAVMRRAYDLKVMDRPLCRSGLEIGYNDKMA